MNASFTMLVLWAGLASAAGAAAQPADGTVVKDVLDVRTGGENLLRPDRWRPFGEGFQRQGDMLICDSGGNGGTLRGACQNVELNQTRPEPILAVAWSEADAAARGKGSSERDYARLSRPDVRRRHSALRAGGRLQARQPRLAAQPARGAAAASGQAADLLSFVPQAFRRRPLSRRRAGSAPHAPGSRHLRRRRRDVQGPAPRRFPGPRRGRQRAVPANRAAGRGAEARLPHQPPKRGHDLRRHPGRRHGQGPRGHAGLCSARRSGRRCAGWTTRGRAVRSGRGPRQSTPRASMPAWGGSRAGRWPRWPTTGKARPWASTCSIRPSTAWPTTPAPGELFLAYDIGLTPEKPAARLRFCRYHVRPAMGLPRGAGRVLRRLPRAVPLPHARAGPVDAVRQDQPGEGLGGFRLQIQGRERRDPLGRRPRHPHLPLYRAHDLVDDACPRRCRGPWRRRWPRPGGWPARAISKPGPCSPAAITTPRGSSPPGCSTRPGATAPCGA